VLVDGDTVFQPDTLGRLIAPLAARDVGAVSGNTKVGNRHGLLGGWQHLEYVMGFNLDRRLFDLLGTIPTVPGAIGAFRRAALAAAGGVSADTLAEDTDLTMALCRSSWRVVYAPGAIAWTEAPSSLRQLWRQRYRWSYGTMQAMWKHRRAVIERGQSGRFGRYCLTYLALFHVLLPLIAPAVDVFSVYGLMFLNPVKVIGFWLGFLLLQAVAGGYALRLDGERLRSLWLLPIQQIGYRQLMYLVTVQSVITALLGTRQRWQVIRRAGIFAGQSAVGTKSPALCAADRRTAAAGGRPAGPVPAGRHPVDLEARRSGLTALGCLWSTQPDRPRTVAEEAGASPARSRHCDRGSDPRPYHRSAAGQGRGGPLIRQPGDSGRLSLRCRGVVTPRKVRAR